MERRGKKTKHEKGNSHQSNQDYLTVLWKDVLGLIFMVLDVIDLGIVCQVCTVLRDRVMETGRVPKFKALWHKDKDLMMLAAIKANEVGLVHLVLRHDADAARRWILTDKITGRMDTAAECAARVGNEALLHWFINKGASFHDGFYGACASGNTLLIDWFIDEKHVSLYTSAYGGMMRAARGGHIETVRHLLKKMDDESGMLVVKYRKNAICYGLFGSCDGGHQHIAEEMLSLGADDMGCALYHAVLYQQFDMVRWLITEKDCVAWDKGLMASARIGSEKWVRFFVNHAKKNAVVLNYEGAMSDAKHYDHTEVFGVLETLSQE